MRVVSIALLLAVVAGSPLEAQQRRRGGPGQAPPPAAWLSADSVASAVDLTAGQRGAFMARYAVLDSLMQHAAQIRTEAREAMGSGNREQMAAFRERMTALAEEVSRAHQAIRAVLTESQHARFDALPAPEVMRRRTRG